MKKVLVLVLSIFISLFADDLDDIKSSKQLRHLGVPYANFVTGLGDGLDVELIKGFAKYLGVEYKYVPTTWDNIYGDLTGQNVKKAKNGIELLGKKEIKGDLIANGLTILPWRAEVLNYSTPTFPSGVWVITKANSTSTPIIPSKSVIEDINNVKKILINKSLLTLPNTCLDATLYDLQKEKIDIFVHPNSEKLIEMVPTVIDAKVDFTLLDVPDALIALEKWPGEIKVIGPVSSEQEMAVGFRKDSKKLLEEFNKYFETVKKDGTYNKLVEKYYPSVFYYYESFFNK